MISSKDLSVIVQGAISVDFTPRCLQSIRRHLPDAEIILSTWKGSAVEGLNYDVLVLNDDPGGLKYDFVYNAINNTNRQLVSVQGGLKKASRPFCLKLRTDAFLKSVRFLEYWDQFQVRDTSYSVFEHKLLVGTVFSREAASCQEGVGFPIPFHPSDIWLMGLTADLCRYFLKAELMSAQDLTNWPYKYPNRLPYESPLWRYAPEQYYLVSFLKRHLDIDVQFDDWSDWNPENIRLSQNILYHNFIFLGLAQSGIHNQKHRWAHVYDHKIHGLITHDVFQKNYKKFCNPNYIHAKESRKMIRACEIRYRGGKILGKILAALFFDKQKRKQVRNKIADFFI